MQDTDMIGQGYHILAKPFGPVCNMNCGYCFYLEKKSLYSLQKNFRMSDDVLEAFIRKYISTQSVPEVQFVWQGGEPTLMGIPFYEKVVALQKKYANGKKIVNSIQTNGLLIDDEWCRFLKKNGFLVGVSLDGPAEIHDTWRVDSREKPTHSTVEAAVKLLQKHRVEFNILVCVTHQSASRAREIYNYLKNLGVQFIQFTPVVERIPDDASRERGLTHASPHTAIDTGIGDVLTDYSVQPGEYGSFLMSVFDEWVRHDVGETFVMNFEWALSSWMGLPSTICIFSRQCGRALAIEHNGDIYSCDHYVYQENFLGNILNESPEVLLNLPLQKYFGEAKETSLPEDCRSCEFLFACNGECPRHRFVSTGDGEPKISYLCPDYKKYFRHIHPYMRIMGQLIENRLPVSKIMEAVKDQ